jgi:ABC-type multidrug transport system ATPase subunit
VEDHFPHLTVGQTLNFAVATRTPTAHIHENTDMLFSTFGLRHSLQTLVGNDSVGGSVAVRESEYRSPKW